MLHLINIRIRTILNISIWLIDGTLTGTTTPGQSEPGSNCNEGVLGYFPVSGSPELDAYHQMPFSVIFSTYHLVEWGSYSTSGDTVCV